ncbi:hypothetical protein [Methanobacterium oryzae]|uniref:hypothetical protein n=1 Tax=Methanobacterium oryzae TaxID=69540 RepID=UPI003D1E3E78
MKLKTGVFLIFLVIGLLGVPNCIFAQDYDYSSNAVLESSIPTMTQTNGLNVQVKGGGGKGGFSSSKSVSKTVKKLDSDDDDDSDSDDGGSWWIAIIIIIIILVMIAAWYFFLRK